MANMSTSENITWFPLTPALFEENYRGVAVRVDDILRGGNITANSESRHLASSHISGRPLVDLLHRLPTQRSRLTAAFSFASLNLSEGMDHFFRLAVSRKCGKAGSS